MTFSPDEAKVSKTALATALKDASALDHLRQAAREGVSWNDSLAQLYHRLKFNEMFALNSASSNDEQASVRVRDLQDLLAKNRTGRLKDVCLSVQGILDNSAGTALDPAKAGFWHMFFTARDAHDAELLLRLVESIVESNQRTRRVLLSELSDLMAGNGLGHVDLSKVSELLSGRGVKVYRDLPSRVMDAIENSGANPLALVLPENFQGSNFPTYTLGRARDGVHSVHQLTHEDLPRAMRFYDQRGNAFLSRKKAVSEIKSFLPSSSSVAEIFITYHLQFVSKLKSKKVIIPSIIVKLADQGLVEADINHLLNISENEKFSGDSLKPRRNLTPPTSNMEIDRKIYWSIEQLLDERRLMAAIKASSGERTPQSDYGHIVASRVTELQERLERDIAPIENVNDPQTWSEVKAVLSEVDNIREYCVDNQKVEHLADVA